MLPVTPLTPCGMPAGMNSTSPGLIGCVSPPTIFPPSSFPPVVYMPDPSVTTHTSAVLGCTRAVSAAVIRRMFTL